MLDEPKKSQERQLEGIAPDKYKGDRGKMIVFLTQFKRYILMNCDASITCDPFKCSALFLSLIGGLKVEGWVKQSYDWLNKAKQNPNDVLPFGTMAWEILEQDFR
jgi:hypothetical protein